ncbi:MAG: flagellar biosynthesis regulator FlaF [Opitutales bacterium]|nr:flagellar biosynthesis regulator FlaF [Opitutales bacterium]
MQKNPLKAYEKARKQTISGREIEATVLEKGAIRLRRCQQNWKENQFDRDLDEALRFNQRVWDIFNSDWQSPNNQLPKDIRQDLLSLSVFVRKTTLEIMAEPKVKKLDVLIQINENLAQGLRGQLNPEQSNSDASTLNQQA